MRNMKLEMLEKLRKIAKSKIGNNWVGIESWHYNGKWRVKCIIYQEGQINPCRVELTVGDEISIKKLESLKRVPMHIVYVDSALKELENADFLIDNYEFDKAIKALWGSIIYSLKAYGLISKGCRIVEISLMDLAKEFSKLMEDEAFFDKIRRIHSIVRDPFEVSLETMDVELMREDVRDVVERIINKVLQ